MSNVNLLKDYLDEIGLRYRENTDSESGNSYLILQEVLKGGQTVTILFEFPENVEVVSIKIWDIATIDSPLKREELLKLLNELNWRYRFGKFSADDKGQVTMDWAVMTIDNFDCKFIVDLCGLLLRTLEEEYPKLMKLQWA